MLLVLAPAVCVLAGIGVSEITSKMFESMKNSFVESQEAQEQEFSPEEPEIKEVKENDKKKPAKKPKKPAQQKGAQPKSQQKSRVPFILALFLVGIITHSTFTYVCHSVHVASEAYSSPSVVLAGRRPDGSKQIIDDFRESYDWL